MKDLKLDYQNKPNLGIKIAKKTSYLDMDILYLFLTARGNQTNLVKFGNFVFISYDFDGYIGHDFCQEAEKGVYFVSTVDEMEQILKAWEKLVSHEFYEITIMKKDGKIVIEGKV